MGLPFDTKGCKTFMCTLHSKEQIIQPRAVDKAFGAPPKVRGDFEMLEEEEEAPIPEMPPLEEIPSPPAFGIPRPSSSNTLSTGVSSGEFTGMRQEIGGRDQSGPPKNLSMGQPVMPDEMEKTRNLSQHVSNSQSDMVDKESDRKTQKCSNARRNTSFRPSSEDTSSPSSFSEDIHSSSRGSHSTKRRKIPMRKKRHRKHSSDSRPIRSSSHSHNSIRALLPKGLCFPKIRRTRPAVRMVDLEPGKRIGRSKRDKYDAIVGRLGAMAEKEEKKAGCNTKIEQFDVCALRGFGIHRVVLGAGTYGPELESCLRRQGRSEKGRLWRQKLRIPVTNRIARAAASGGFWNFSGGGTDELSATLADCFALDAAKYHNHTWDGAKLEPMGKEPHTLACFASPDKQQIRLFGMLYGKERMQERLDALAGLTWSH